MVGGLRRVVMLVKCDPNRLRGYGAVGGRKWPFPITLASGLYNSLYYRTSRYYYCLHRLRSVLSFCLLIQTADIHTLTHITKSPVFHYYPLHKNVPTLYRLIWHL